MPRTFLLSRTDAIGDVVLTLPMAGQLKRLVPGCRVILLGRAYTQAVGAACPWIDEFVDADKLLELSSPEQIAALKALQVDCFIHVFPNRNLAQLARRAGIRHRVGTRNRWFHWLTCTELISLSRRNSILHESQLNLLLLGKLQNSSIMPLQEVASLLKLRPTETLRPELGVLLAARKTNQLNVVLHPRSRGSAREWGLAHFGTLAQLLHAAGHRVFITGTAAEGEELKQWLTKHRAFLAADLTGKLTLPQLLAFLDEADGIVAGSTGPLHLAAGLGRYALGLYPPIKPMHPGRWGPLGQYADYLVFNRPSCQDCRREPTGCACIKALAPAQALQRVLAWKPMFTLPN